MTPPNPLNCVVSESAVTMTRALRSSSGSTINRLRASSTSATVPIMLPRAPSATSAAVRHDGLLCARVDSAAKTTIVKSEERRRFRIFRASYCHGVAQAARHIQWKTGASPVLNCVKRVEAITRTCDRRERVPSTGSARHHFAAGDYCAANSAIVADEDERGEQIFDRRRARGAHREQRLRLEIEHEKIGRLAGLE